MNLKDVMKADFRTKKGKDLVNDALIEIAPLSKYSSLKRVPLEKIERLLFKCQERYDVKLTLIYISGSANYESFVYSGGISDLKGNMIDTVHGIEIYELFAKSAIRIWSMIKNKEVKRRK